MTVIAIDPGPVESAFCELTGSGRLHSFAKWKNDDLLRWDVLRYGHRSGCALAIEMIASYGMPVGAEVFDTCVWIGRFAQAWGGPHALVKRKEVGLHLCNSPRANDSTVRQALIDRFGGKQVAIGKKASPGPLYGVTGDVWQALAVACYWQDKCGAA